MEAIISPQILKWAISRKDISETDLAQKVKVKPEKIVDWRNGLSYPTFNQAKQVAQKLSIPFGYLFMSEIPDERIPIPDLRRIDIKHTKPISPDFLDVMNDALRKQYWYKENLIKEGAGNLEFVGKFNINSNTQKVADDIALIFGINENARRNVTSWSDYLKNLVELVEERGIIVLRSGVVNGNTHRSLDVDEFRGFALCDPIVSFIFVNGKDSVAGRIFTLIHEIVHIFIGESGISNVKIDEIDIDQEQKIESFCDAVASEVLVPEEEFNFQWNLSSSILENIYKLVRVFRVSSVVILRKALDMEIISRDEFFESYYKELAEQKTDRGRSGGDFFNNFISRNSHTLTHAIINATFEGRLLFREASQLLNVKIKTLEKVAEKIYGV